mmetsp:Transcript_43159/g.139359  ORF Transcript_43159/g.139359 Transcript_43159/m.139359 type:complete len:216 (+) Transcript_43159:316-963(+)
MWPGVFGAAGLEQHQSVVYHIISCRTRVASAGGSVAYRSGIRAKCSTRAVAAASGASDAAERSAGGSGKASDWRTASGVRELLRKENSRSTPSRPPSGRPAGSLASLESGSACFEIPFSRSSTWSSGQGSTGSLVSEPGMVPLWGAQKRSSPHVSGGTISRRPRRAASRKAARSCTSWWWTTSKCAATPITPAGRSSSRRTTGTYVRKERPGGSK